ncbi:MAG TPA: PVC-type heme-binding CxxCH protein [Planctomycetota bacterium]
MLFLLLLLQDPRVPADCSLEKVAASPLVERPIMAGFDDRGRLYVADSSGVNLKIDDLQKAKPHRIVRLEDVDADGRFDTSVVFADQMTFPMGALWHEGALFVCAPPSVWRLRDLDGDGKADERTELVTKFGSNGNAADIHGPFLGPDGRIYWTDGRHGHNIKRADGTVMAGQAARVFRCRPDGSDVEVVCGGGMDNPVEIAFTEEGEPLVTVALLHAQPRRIDSIIFAIEGGVFPYHDVVKEFKRTGDLLPSSLDVGWVAPSGFLRAKGAHFGGAWFSAQFNTHKVQRHAIERDGAGFKGTSEDFLVSEHADFHPTDVLEAPDGSLLVLDTGGWFRIGCPTSRIDKPQALGAIWRVRSKTTRPVVASPAEAVWKRTLDAKAALSSPEFSARMAGARLVGLDRDKAAAPRLRALLEDPAPAMRREAATALGRIGDKEAVGPLLDVPSGDRFLEHAVIYALISIGDRDALRAALKRRSRAALIALDQLDGLSRDEITPFIDPSDPATLKAALDIVAARGWAAEIVSLLRTWLAGPPREEIRSLIVAFAKDPAVRDLVARAMRETPRVVLLEAMAQAPLDRLPAVWLAEARWALDHADPAVVRQAVATLRGTGEADAALLAIAGDAARPEELRVEALAAIRGAALDEPRFALLRAALAGAPLLRLSAAQALGAAALTDAQLLKLTEDVAKAGGLELPRLLAAYERPNKHGEKLLAALGKAPGVESLSADALRRTSAGPHAAALLKRLEGDVEAQRARLAELASALEGGDPGRGREIFQGRKASCAACHAIAGQGGRVGPDLSKIGGIRAPKDLLESIVFPSASFVRGYEPTVIRVKDGGIVDGVIARETADAVTLTLADRTERRVPRAAIDALAQGKTSIMPQGLDRQLSAAELRDLIAYLSSLK